MRSLTTMLILSCLFLPWAARADLPSGLGDIKGRVVWVDFWASWCAPCRRSFPWMNQMQRKYAREGFEIIAVNVDKERSAAEQFLKETPASFELKFDPDGELAQAFDVKAMPTSYLIDASTGKIIERHLGFKLADASHYEAAIRAALTAASDAGHPER